MNGKTGPPSGHRSGGITRRSMIGGMMVSAIMPAVISEAWGKSELIVGSAAGTPAAPFPLSGHTATALPGGAVLVAGGYLQRALSSAHLFDPATGSWTAVAPMQTARYYHAAACLPDGRVLVCGGITGSAPNAAIPALASQRILSSAEIYDPASNIWSPAPPMSMPRAGHSAATLTNGVLVVGGYYLAALASTAVFNGVSWAAG